jgi:hypothetical protein
MCTRGSWPTRISLEQWSVLLASFYMHSLFRYFNFFTEHISAVFFQDVLRRRRSRKGDAGFSLTFAGFAGLIGILVGLMMSLIFSSPPATA